MWTTVIELGRPFGVPLRLRGWGFVLLCGNLFFACVLGFASLFPEWGQAARWLAAGAALGVYVAAVLLHEAAHASVASHHGLRVKEIALITLGARVTLVKPVPNPPLRVVALFAAAGPLSDVLLTVALVGIAVLAAGRAPYVFGVAFLGACITLSLAVCNLLPIFPLDGGRLVRTAMIAVRRRRGG